MKLKDQGEVKITRTACPNMCAESCNILAHVKDGVLIKVEPADFPAEPQYRYACKRALSMPKLVHNPDRLKYPIKRVGERGEGKWERISWDEALDTIASRLKDIFSKYGPESMAMIAGAISFPIGGLYIGQRFTSAIGGTYVNPQGSLLAGQICADMTSYGSRWGIPYLEDLEDPHLIVLWGSNSLVTFPNKYRHQIRPAQDKGHKMVVISPIFTPSAAKADEWIPIRPGTDAALALGMINIIVKEGLCDEAFLINHTGAPFLVRSDNGLFLREESPSGDSPGKNMIWDTKTNKPQVFDAPGAAPVLRGSYTVNGIECKPAFQLLAESVEQYPLEKVSEITEIAPDVINRLALGYATQRPVVSQRGVGLSRTFYADVTYRAINLLAAVTGNINIKGPEYDFSTALNLMPFILPGGRMYKPMSSFQFYENHRTGKPYPLKALWITSQNPVNAIANHNNLKKALQSMEFIVVADLFMTATADYADILLPNCTVFESTSMALPYGAVWGTGQPYLTLQPKVIEPVYESRPDTEIFSEVAKRMGVGEFFDKTNEEYIEMALASGHPSMEGVTLEKLKEGPVRMKPMSVSLPDTLAGRIGFYTEKLKEFGQALPVYIESPDSNRQERAKKYPLHIFQMHGKGRYHAMFRNVAQMRELEPEPFMEMNPVDAEKRGINDGDLVVTFNDRGKVKVKARFNDGVRPGTVCVGEGWQPDDFAEGSPQELTGTTATPAQEAIFTSVAQMQGVLVEVKKA